MFFTNDSWNNIPSYDTPINAKYSMGHMYYMDSSISLKFGLLMYFRGANTVKRGALIKNA